jgi:hypothetical protein
MKRIQNTLVLSALCVFSFYLSACTAEQVNDFSQGKPVTPSYRTELRREAEDLNQSLLDLNARIQAAEKAGTAEADASLKDLYQKEAALLQKRDDLSKALQDRQNALLKEGQSVDADLRATLDSLTETGMILRRTVVPNPFKTK